MDKMKRNFLSLLSMLLFIIHILYSPYPINSLKRFKESFSDFLLCFKVKKYKVEIDKDGDVFRILSAGFNAIEHTHGFFIFSFEKYKFIGKERGIYVVKVTDEIYNNIEIKCFDIHGKKEGADSLLNYLKNIKGDALLFFGIKDEATLNWNKELDDLFKKMGAKFSLIDKYRYSYIFVTRKKDEKFISLFEKLSPDKIIFSQIKVKS